MSAVGGFDQGDRRGFFRRIGAQALAGVALLARKPRGEVRWADTRTLAIRAGVAFAAFLLIVVLFDVAAVKGARRLPEWLIGLFDDITDFGKSGWFLWPLAGVMLAVAAAPAYLPPMARRVLAAIAVRAGFLFLAIGLPSLFGTIVKRLIGRARPFVGDAADPYFYHPFSWNVEYASLPSGHATTAFAAAVAVGMLWPRLRAVMWVYAIVIGISRVVLTAHHPSDVLASVFVGIVGALLVRNYFAARRLAFGISAEGSAVVFAGPSWWRTKSIARALLAD
jgi:membrane-associated phospholipid phosphatase